ncbi:DNA helicase [Liquorilactobacillus sucicola DSM 21376 = JCM 15457]|nr:DNA helicase [Liquorilactobacillus sucicola DSM 21376 = JCM 15457]
MDKERQQEQQRVDGIVAKIKKYLKKKEQEYSKAHLETSSVEKNYVQNAKINTFEIDDRIETNAEVQQQKQLVAKSIETETILKRQVKTLKALQESPYFGRVDILDEDELRRKLYTLGYLHLLMKAKIFWFMIGARLYQVFTIMGLWVKSVMRLLLENRKQNYSKKGSS